MSELGQALNIGGDNSFWKSFPESVLSERLAPMMGLHVPFFFFFFLINTKHLLVNK